MGQRPSVFVDLSLSRYVADVIPAHPLHPQSAPEEDPLLHLPADPAAAAAVHFRHVPYPLYEDDLPAAHDPAHPRQVSRLPVRSRDYSGFPAGVHSAGNSRFTGEL